MQSKKDIAIAIVNAKLRFDKIAMLWMRSDPVILDVFCMLDKTINMNQETIGISLLSKHPSLQYNPFWVKSVNDEILETVLSSELLKVLLKHCTTRLKEPRQISSLSSNITINELKKDQLMNLVNSGSDFIPDSKKYNLPPEDCYEEYYRQLMDRLDKTNKIIKQIWQSMSKEEKDKAIQDAQEKYDKSKAKSGDDKSKAGDNEGEGEQSDSKESGAGEGNEFKEFKNETEALKEYYNPNGTSNDGWGANDLFDADIAEYVNSRKDSARGWGTHTGNFMGSIIAAHEAKISYKEIINRFAKSVMIGESITSRMKVNRRFDLLLPGYRRKYKSKIIMGLDESGSMTNEDVAEGFAVINQCCKHADIDYITFDTEVKMIEKNYRKAKKSFKVGGRGGTDPTAAINYALEHKADGLVIYSDMEFSPNIQEPLHLKVLWLGHKNGTKCPVQWGFHANLKRFDDTH